MCNPAVARSRWVLGASRALVGAQWQEEPLLRRSRRGRTSLRSLLVSRVPGHAESRACAAEATRSRESVGRTSRLGPARSAGVTEGPSGPDGGSPRRSGPECRVYGIRHGSQGSRPGQIDRSHASALPTNCALVTLASARVSCAHNVRTQVLARSQCWHRVVSV